MNTSSDTELYSYDPSAADLYCSDQWQVLEERQGDETTAQYVWSPVYVNAMVLRDRDSDSDAGVDERLYPTHDANFNITSVVDTNGDVVERFVYDPYGQRTVLAEDWSAIQDGLDFHHGFQGGKQDAATGLINFQRRDYDPLLSRWIQVDPAGFVEGVNLYQFVVDAPISRLDPSGEMSILDVLQSKAAKGGISGSWIVPVATLPPGVVYLAVNGSLSLQDCCQGGSIHLMLCAEVSLELYWSPSPVPKKRSDRPTQWEAITGKYKPPSGAYRQRNLSGGLSTEALPACVDGLKEFTLSVFVRGSAGFYYGVQFQVKYNAWTLQDGFDFDLSRLSAEGSFASGNKGASFEVGGGGYLSGCITLS